jgi:hypothetical protein
MRTPHIHVAFVVLVIAGSFACRPAGCMADEAADTIYAGDTVTVIKDNVELGLRDKPAATLKVGDRLHVTEVRGVWIGGYALKDGQRYTGWVHQDEVKLVVVAPDDVTPIERPDLADDPQAVTALRELDVKLDLNDKGRVHSADGTESKIEDAAVQHFQGLHQLATIDLSGRPISDAGFRALGGSKVLQELYLDNTRISDESLARVAEFPNLEVLAVAGTGIKGEGLVHLQKLKSLRVLNIAKCEVTDDALAHLEKIPSLEVLALNGTKVTTAGLAHLKPLAKLRVLNVIGCDVEDVGLEQLKGLDELRMLYVDQTKVTEEGIENLKTACPSLAIFR